MLRLPIVILARVCSFLDLKDLWNVARLSRAYSEIFEPDQDIWTCLLRERYQYTLDDSSPLPPFLARNTYCKFAAGLRYPARFEGAHTSNPTYWTRDRPCPESQYGKVMFLKHVWWLEGAMCLKNIPPGRYAVVWRVQANFGRYRSRLYMFHTIVPHRASHLLGLSTTRELIEQRSGDGWIQKAAGTPTPTELIETPRHTYGFHHKGDGTVWQVGAWYYLLFPASLQIHEISDLYCGTYDVAGDSHGDIAFDWVQLLPLSRDDPSPLNSKPFQMLMAEQRQFVSDTRIVGAEDEEMPPYVEYSTDNDSD